jgi:hypothetical protein
MEIFRNANGDFELVFPLTNPDGSGDWVTGKAAELDSNTILIGYHNATVWTTASFASGTPVEISSFGAYHITILNSWFSALDENFSIIVKIVDDAGTKTWKDTGVLISPKMKIGAIEISRDDAVNECLKINNASGKAITVTSGDDIAIDIQADDEALKLTSTLLDAIKIVSTAGRGIHIDAFSQSIQLDSSNSEIGLQTKRIALTGPTAAPALTIAAGGTDQPAISIISSAGDGIDISAEKKGIDIAVNNGIGIQVVSTNSNAISIIGTVGITITGNSSFGLDIGSYSSFPGLRIRNTSTGNAMVITNSTTVPAVHVYNAGDGKAVYVQAQTINNDAVTYESTGTGKDLNAKEIINILADTDETQTKLPAVGPIANQTDINNLSNNTRYRVSVPTFARIPESGDIMIPVFFYFLDDNGLPFDPDTNELACQVRAVNQQAYKVVMYDDEAGTTPATINTTFVPSYYTVIKVVTGEYMTYLKLANTETADTWQLKFKFKESTNEITIPSQILITETGTLITLDDSNANKDIIAKSLKERDVSGTTAVSGSIYKGLKDDLDAIVAKLPTGTISNLALTTVIDGQPLSYIFELIMALVNGRYLKDSPVAGQLTIFKRDNASVLTIIQITQTEATRVS